MDERLERGWRVVSQHAIVPWVLRFQDLPETAKVLEVGAGPGLTAEAFVHRYPTWDYTAGVMRPEMLEQCRARLDGKATVEEADPRALPYPDATFDIVLSIGVWHLIDAWGDALVQSRRVLKPGGWLVLVDLLPSFFKGPLARAFPPVKTYTISEMREQLGAAGFARFRVRAAGALWYRLVAETPRDGEAAMRTDGSAH